MSAFPYPVIVIDFRLGSRVKACVASPCGLCWGAFSPAIPWLPLGGEPLGLGDLLRGHLIGDGVSREPRPAEPTGGGEAVPHVGTDTIWLRETSVGPIPTVHSSMKVAELLLSECIALVGGETQPRQAFSIRLATRVKLELGFPIPFLSIN